MFFICLIKIHSLNAQAQESSLYMIGAGMSQPFTDRHIRIDIGRSVGIRWAVGAGVITSIPSVLRNISEDEKKHESLLTGESESNESDWKREKHAAIMEITHWPWKTFEKGFIAIGCRYGERSGTDCLVGAGYMMRIAGGLAATLKIETGIINSPAEPIISLNLNYIF